MYLSHLNRIDNFQDHFLFRHEKISLDRKDIKRGGGQKFKTPDLTVQNTSGRFNHNRK